MPLIRVVARRAAAARPPTVEALPAVAELVAEGTVPRALSLMSSPVSEPFWTLEPLIALGATCRW